MIIEKRTEMPYYNFDKDVEVAKKTEWEVVHLLEKKYGAKVSNINKDNRFDILALIKGKNFTFEVKEDFLGEVTGNVGLEFSCRGKPSGIQTSQANYYVYKLHTKNSGIQFVLLKTSTLKKMVADKLYFRIVNGGDKNSNSMNYLFKYDVFIKYGKIIR